MTDNVTDNSKVSSVEIGQRVTKTPDNPYGFNIVKTVPIDQPVILSMGGTGSTNKFPSVANGYLSRLEQWLNANGIKEGVGFYGVMYNFASHHDLCSRKLLFQQHHRNPTKRVETYDEETLNPAYVEDVFQKAFLGRISDEKGQRLSVDEAVSRMRKLTVFAHCHGAYTFLKVEEKMQNKMRELGYSPTERARIQKELVCVAHAPHAPLGVSKSTMISFASGSDPEIPHYNNFTKELISMPVASWRNSYFPEERGEVIIAPTLGDEAEQHNFIPNDPALNPRGRSLYRLEGATLAHATQRYLSNSSKPKTPLEIICGQRDDIKKYMDVLKRKGEELWDRLRTSAQKRRQTQRQAQNPNGGR
ncbi:MAG: hypothetical protein ILP11_00795 [Alphaproteobacteria bacterium]|nr:hypothetical protein [Alphaproteobacteria bacterium]